jgi:hypothetical protein
MVKVAESSARMLGWLAIGAGQASGVATLPDRTVRGADCGRVGDQALVSLALTIATFPGLSEPEVWFESGHACTRVRLAGSEVTVSH